MKKKICLIMICLLMTGILAGCGNSDPYADYDLKDYFKKVGEYKGLTAEPYTISVSKKEIKEKIDSDVKAAAKSESVSKGSKVKDGDTVNIDYVGKINGKAFDGGSAEGYDLVIGSNSFIDGFESGLIGKKVGSKVKLNLTFPKDYSQESLQGKDVVFEVTINSAKRSVTPDYDLDFVKNNTKYKSIKSYEASVKKELYDEKETEAKNNQKTTLWSDVLEKTEVKKYPEEELDYYMEFNSNQLDDIASENNMTRKEVLSSYNLGSEKDFKAVNEDSSKLRIKQEMLIEYIADKEGLTYTNDEKKKYLKDLEDQGYDEDAIKKQTGREADEYVHIQLLYEKVQDFILDNAKASDKSAKKTAK